MDKPFWQEVVDEHTMSHKAIIHRMKWTTKQLLAHVLSLSPVAHQSGAELSWVKPSQFERILQCILTEADSDAGDFLALYLIYHNFLKILKIPRIYIKFFQK